MDASYTTYFHPLDLTSLKILIDDNYRYHSEYSIQIEDFFPLQNEVSKLKANSDIPPPLPSLPIPIHRKLTKTAPKMKMKREEAKNVFPSP